MREYTVSPEKWRVYANVIQERTQTSKPPLECFRGTMRMVCCTKTESTTFLAAACMGNAEAMKDSRGF